MLTEFFSTYPIAGKPAHLEQPQESGGQCREEQVECADAHSDSAFELALQLLSAITATTTAVRRKTVKRMQDAVTLPIIKWRMYVFWERILGKKFIN